MYPFIKQEDCQMRLDKTVCMYDNVPVFVTVSGDFPTNKIHIQPFMSILNGGNAKKQLIDVTDAKFDPTPQRLGYVQFDSNYCFYVSRSAERRPRQGLSDSSLNFKECGQIVSGNRVLYCKGMHDTLCGKFKTFSEAVDCIKAGYVTVAFDYDFALTHKKDRSGNVSPTLLMYCDKVVGKLSKDNSIILHTDVIEASYLQQMLSDLGVRSEVETKA